MFYHHHLQLARAFLENIWSVTSYELYQITKTLHGLLRNEEGPQSWPSFKAFHSKTSESAQRFHDCIFDNRELLLNAKIVDELLAKKDKESSEAESNSLLSLSFLDGATVPLMHTYAEKSATSKNISKIKAFLSGRRFCMHLNGLCIYTALHLAGIDCTVPYLVLGRK